LLFVASLAVWAGIVRALIGLWPGGQERRLGLILLVWFWTPVWLMSFSTFSIHIHYLLLTCPAGHVLAAWGIVAAGPKSRIWQGGEQEGGDSGQRFAGFGMRPNRR
jgi:hypothetical protein